MKTPAMSASSSKADLSFATLPATSRGGLAAMLDDTLGPAVLIRTRGEQDCATIDLRVSFLSAAWPGKRFGEGRIAKIGKTIAFLEGRLRDATGAVIARASASARVVPTRGLARA